MPRHIVHSIADFDLRDQTVFIRTDFNIPVKEGVVTSHVRLGACLPTIRYALEQKAHVVVASHRGRPGKDSVKNKKAFSLEPFGYYLGEQLKCEVLFIEEIESALPKMLLSSLNSKKIILLENLRFCPGEEQNDPVWTQELASYVDVYINEAFSVSHRSHTSVDSLPRQVKKRGQGFALQKERQMLDYIRLYSPGPVMLLVGGRKVSDKIQTISRLIDRIDTLLVGGVMAYTFLKAQGVETGSAFVETDSLSLVKDVIHRLKEREKNLLLPVDHVVVPDKTSSGKINKKTIKTQAIPRGYCPMDIGSKTCELFSTALQKAGTVFWNGPLGKFENPEFNHGTRKLCEEIARLAGAFRVAGGGDSISAILNLGCSHGFNYISTGGGAALKYLETGSLPGIQSLLMEEPIND